MKCAKADCNNDAIKRGKYCIVHRTTKRKRDEERHMDEEKLNQDLINQLLNADLEEERRRRNMEKGYIETKESDAESQRRSLIEEQNLQYLEAQRIDALNIKKKQEENERKQLAKQKEIDRKISIRQKFTSYTPLPSDIMLQFRLPEFCIKVKQSFHNNAILLDLFDFIDMTLEDNNIEMTDYHLVLYPNDTFYRSDAHRKLIDINIIHGVSILIQRDS